MYPLILHAFGGYPIFLIAASACASLVTWHYAREFGVGRRQLVVALMCTTLAAFVGAKLWSIAERANSYAWSLELTYGYRYPGGLLGLLSALLMLRLVDDRVRLASIADAIAMAFPWAMVIVRLGCFLNGCCGGAMTSLPWGLRFPEFSQVWTDQVVGGLISPGASHSHPVHPLQLYFVGVSASIGIILVLSKNRVRGRGELFLVFLILYDVSVASLEPFRARYNLLLPLTAAVVAAVALGALAFTRRRALASVLEKERSLILKALRWTPTPPSC